MIMTAIIVIVVVIMIYIYTHKIMVAIIVIICMPFVYGLRIYVYPQTYFLTIFGSGCMSGRVGFGR